MIKLNPNPILKTVNANRHMNTYVSASSNMAGTPNEVSAKRLAQKLEKFVDKNTMASNERAYLRARRPYPAPEQLAAAPAAPAEKAVEEIIPENSINFIC